MTLIPLSLSFFPLFVSFFFLVSMEFFDDILIPYEYLQQPSKLYLFGDGSKLQCPQQHKTKSLKGRICTRNMKQVYELFKFVLFMSHDEFIVLYDKKNLFQMFDIAFEVFRTNL